MRSSSTISVPFQGKRRHTELCSSLMLEYLFCRISGGELFEKVCNDDNLTEKEVVRYMKQILQGVEHMHKKHIVHLDLKVRTFKSSSIL